MPPIREDPSGYASARQREVLLQLVLHPGIEDQFFLTGGTALSVFYLGHRTSEDIDLFTREEFNLGEIDFWVRGQWPNASSKIQEGPHFLSYLVREVRVDFAIDPLANDEERGKYPFENGHFLNIDTLGNITSNKFCSIVSRTEPKDFVDFYFILKAFSNIMIEDVYAGSRQKDAIFDDPPTAAFQLENGMGFIRENPSLLPPLRKELDLGDFSAFYDRVGKWLYDRIRPGK